MAEIRRVSPARVAVMSADPMAVVEAQSLRADASLAKPFSLPQLRELLDVLTRG